MFNMEPAPGNVDAPKPRIYGHGLDAPASQLCYPLNDCGSVEGVLKGFEGIPIPSNGFRAHAFQIQAFSDKLVCQYLFSAA